MGNAVPAKIIFCNSYPYIIHIKIAEFRTDVETLLMLLSKKGHFDTTRILLATLASVNSLRVADKNKFMFAPQWDEIKPNNIILRDTKERKNVILDIIPPGQYDNALIDKQEKNRMKRILAKRIQKDLDRIHDKNIILEMGLIYTFAYRNMLPGFNTYNALIVYRKDRKAIAMMEYGYDNPQIVFFVNARQAKNGNIKNILFNLM